MKNLIFIIVFSILLSFSLNAQQKSEYYYYYQGEKIYLERENNVKVIHFYKEPTTQLNQLRSQSIQVDTVDDLTYRISGDFKQRSVNNLLFSEQRDSNILYISDMLLYEGHPVWESDNIIVKVFPDANLSEVLEKNKIPYKEFKRIGSNPQNYLVKLDVSKHSALEIANIRAESPEYFSVGQRPTQQEIADQARNCRSHLIRYMF